MASTKLMPQPPLIAIIGPTASGKTRLAIELACEFGGEIICADSRTIYKYMDIGTAKPSISDRKKVTHWGLDLVEPNERFTVAKFKDYADNKILEIRSRGNIPFLVGGTGLYIDSILFDYNFNSPIDTVLRNILNPLTLEELYNYCKKNNIILPENCKNRRYIIRAIERNNKPIIRRIEPIDNTVIVGISTDKETLNHNIYSRNEHFLDIGVVEEAMVLSKRYGWDIESMTVNIYRLVRLYLENEISLEDLIVKATTNDRQLAKRQLTWFRRNSNIQWFNINEAKLYISHLLA